jgi:uncharacterized protein YydD (DUF2326 family)
MLDEIQSTLSTFKRVSFESGVNIALAIRTTEATDTASRNAVGKSSLVALIDFLLGSDADKNHLTRRPELMDARFSLRLTVEGGAHHIERSGADASTPRWDNVSTSLTDLRQRLAWILFGREDATATPSYRALLAIYLRNREAGGLASPLRTHGRQSDLAIYPALTHLLSLDAEITERARAIAESKKQLRALRAAAKDPIFGVVTGNLEELEAEIATLTLSISRARDEIASFQVLDRYEDHVQRADQLSEEIRRLNDRAGILIERERELREALDSPDEQQPDRSYLVGVYEQVGLAMPDAVLRTFDEVRSFHQSVARNRREHINNELSDAKEELGALRVRAADLDHDRAQLMVLLEASGALETFSELQADIALQEGRREALVARRESATSLRRADKHIKSKEAELEEFARMDLIDRDQQVSEIRDLFTRYAFEIYGADRPATLGIEATSTGYRLIPTLGGERSAGVASMALFCFDFTVAVTAHRSGRGPDFLVHDSHLFDSVEERQVARALTLAQDICQREGMQYVVTLNSDAFEAAHRFAPDLVYHECVSLTDEYEAGGLFGIRFN